MCPTKINSARWTVSSLCSIELLKIEERHLTTQQEAAGSMGVMLNYLRQFISLEQGVFQVLSITDPELVVPIDCVRPSFLSRSVMET